MSEELKPLLLDHVTEVGGELEDQATEAATTLAFIERRLDDNDRTEDYRRVTTAAVASILGVAMAQLLKELRGKHPLALNLVDVEMGSLLWDNAAVIGSNNDLIKLDNN